MSERIDGPLLRPHEGSEPEYQVPPRQKCPDCGRPLTIIGVTPFYGLQSSATWWLRCSNGHEFEYDVGWDHTEDAYDDPADRQIGYDLRDADIARRTP